MPVNINLYCYPSHDIGVLQFPSAWLDTFLILNKSSITVLASATELVRPCRTWKKHNPSWTKKVWEGTLLFFSNISATFLHRHSLGSYKAMSKMLWGGPLLCPFHTMTQLIPVTCQGLILRYIYYRDIKFLENECSVVWRLNWRAMKRISPSNMKW